ncbi:MAG TPA: cytochrome c biogenesis heme-transporting ATPase CcmA [Burkholderiaceae bacterium]|nr:cytochrome c biogenesis heme-transporting ATPase CcmA [Burkholderiaceae bacterium]
MLGAIDLECIRGERLLFRGLSFEVAAGVCLHVAGENGAGKTSLLRILCGLLSPSAGEVRWRNESTRSLREAYWAELVYIGHLNGVKDDLTAAENVRFAAALSGHPAAAADIAAGLAALGLAGFKDRPARTLSQGQRRRIALTRLFLAASAPLWILDEPFTALDTRGVAVLVDLIAVHAARGGIVVLTTHQDVPLPTAVQRLELTPSDISTAQSGAAW